MRRHRVPNAYQKIKDASRGQEFDAADYYRLVDGLVIPAGAKETLRKLTPLTYTGFSSEIAKY